MVVVLLDRAAANGAEALAANLIYYRAAITSCAYYARAEFAAANATIKAIGARSFAAIDPNNNRHNQTNS